ncbi:hypothetical protein ACVWZA_000558 [Sphingomonas sp. UYAg733]
MTITLEERVREMLPHADQPSLDRAVASLKYWITENAAAVRSMGPTTRTMAHLSVTALKGRTSVECSFINSRCDLYSVTVSSGAEMKLDGSSHHAPDAAAAMSVIGALLADLGMATSIR